MLSELGVGAFAVYLLPLAAPIAVEVPVAWCLAPRRARVVVARTALFVNLFTHPSAVAAHWWGGVPFVVVELLVLAAEYLAYRAVAELRAPRALVTAGVSNLLTAVLGIAAAAWVEW